MKHIAFIESVVFRIRQSIDITLNKPGSLLSRLVEIYQESTQWLTRLFPALTKCNSCELDSIKYDKFKRYSEEIHDDKLKLKVASLIFKINRPKFSFLRNTILSKRDVSERKSTVAICKEPKNYFDEFCKLLETLENKETNL